MSTNGNSSCHAQERDIHREYRRFKYYIILYIIEKLWKPVQDASIDLPAKLPKKLCASAPSAKPALNTKDGPKGPTGPNVDLIWLIEVI